MWEATQQQIIRHSACHLCWLWGLAFSTAILTGFTGCGETAATPEQAEQAWSPEVTPPERVADSSTTNRSDSSLQNIELVSAETSADAIPTEGTAEWLLMKIAHLKSSPTDRVREPVTDRPGEYKLVQLTPEQTEKEQIRRNEKIIELAMQAIGKTHEDAARVQLFNSAVHYLSEARLQLALDGNTEHAQLLDENAEALFTRDPTSFAAIEASATILKLTQSLANRHADENSQWTLAFARQARLFSERFPQETSRAAVNLIAAGRLCEQHHLSDEAVACFAVVEKRYPDSPYAAQVAGSLRRLRLIGQPLTEFGGSTFDGSFTSISQYRGQALIIAFWASNSAQFRKDLPAIQAAVNRSGGKLTAVGVNLDRNAQAVEQFIRETGMNWTNIFYSDPEKRGSQNIVAHHYGIINVPEYWLIDAQGIVRSIHLDASHLDQEIASAFSR